MALPMIGISQAVLAQRNVKENIMRKMATIRKIDALRAIPGADAIECAIVGGWTCVVKKHFGVEE